MDIQRFVFGPLQVNTYLLYDMFEKYSIVIDPGMSNDSENRRIYEFLREKELELKAVLLTHGHFDHFCGVNFLRKSFDVQVYMHEKDLALSCNSEFIGMFGGLCPTLCMIDNSLLEGVLQFGPFKLKVMETPGHSPGHVSFYIEELNVLFSGDVIFKGSIGRTDLPGSNFEQLKRSILEKIIPLGDDTKLYPGHGVPTDLFSEIVRNPFIRDMLNA